MSPLVVAALAALKLASAHADCSEYAGVILQAADGSYSYTQPQRGTDEHFRIVVQIPRGDKLAAIYHTHPRCNSTGTDRYFSANDVQTAQTLHLPSFIWVGYDSSVREYVPQQTRTVYWGPGQLVSAGTIITHIS